MGLIGKQPIGVEIVVRAEQLAGSSELDLGGEMRVPGLRRRGFSLAEVEGYKVTIDVMLPDQLIELGDLHARRGRIAGQTLQGLVGIEMEIFGQAPSANRLCSVMR